MLALQLHAWHGGPVDRLDRHRLATWRRRLRDLNAVVVYDRAAPSGFSLEPRQVGDGHLTRPPMDGEGEIR
ncbi:hypothetical protein ACNHYB_11875 [Isoptericola jiangsuensis]|uniref:hypothetical protein n=1 Tax=Isoptericola jiangsuensis TaxID=548579 RepID=UPI003AAF276A